MRLGLGAVLALALSGLAQAQPERPTLQPDLTAAPVSAGARTQYGALTFAGGVYLISKQPRVGGIKGLVAANAPDGRTVRLAAVTYGGDFLTLTGTLDDKGFLTGGHQLALTPLRDTDGKVLNGFGWDDAEDLTRPPDASGFIVSFGGHHRITAYADPFDAKGDVIGLSMPQEARPLRGNQGLTGLAALPGGRLVVGVPDGRIWLCPPKQEACVRIHDKGGLHGLPLTGLAYLPGSREELVATYGHQARLGEEPVVVGRMTIAANARLTEIAQLPATTGKVEAVSAVAGLVGWRLYLATDNGFKDKVASRILAFDLAR